MFVSFKWSFCCHVCVLRASQCVSLLALGRIVCVTSALIHDSILCKRRARSRL